MAVVRNTTNHLQVKCQGSVTEELIYLEHFQKLFPTQNHSHLAKDTNIHSLIICYDSSLRTRGQSYIRHRLGPTGTYRYPQT